jgi:hypothetical protein
MLNKMFLVRCMMFLVAAFSQAIVQASDSFPIYNGVSLYGYTFPEFH